MDSNSIMNSPGLWAVSSLMIIVLLVASVIYVKMAFSEAKKLGISKERCIQLSVRLYLLLLLRLL